MKIGISLILLLCSSLFAVQEIERYAIIVGVNYGGVKRDLLKYAHTDAQNVGRVLTEIGGVPKENQTMLLEPSAEHFHRALTDLSMRLDSVPTTNRREIVLYFSGHANENGLFFGNDNYDYRVLRKDIDKLPAQLKVTILDACASGAITQVKGGYRKQAFLVDASNDLSGYAFITSSSNTEASQESEAIGGSFFTHYLVSGMRGAADVSRDGKITLGEAYQFAFNETLNRTQNTQGGAQHPSYDMKLSGSGDVIMTDLRKSDRTIVFGKGISGRIYITNSKGVLVTELYKAQGRVVELGLDQMHYSISVEENNQWKKRSVNLIENRIVIVSNDQLESSEVERTRLRGDAEDSTGDNDGQSTSPFNMSLLVLGTESGILTGGAILGYQNFKFHLSSGVNLPTRDGGYLTMGFGLGYSLPFTGFNLHMLLSEYWVYNARDNWGWNENNWEGYQGERDELITDLSVLAEVTSYSRFSLWLGVSANIVANFDNKPSLRPFGFEYDNYLSISRGMYGWLGCKIGVSYELF